MSASCPCSSIVQSPEASAKVSPGPSKGEEHLSREGGKESGSQP